jgi:hypothetical protein
MRFVAGPILSGLSIRSMPAALIGYMKAPDAEQGVPPSGGAGRGNNVSSLTTGPLNYPPSLTCIDCTPRW